ncbi:MAG TPA: pilus assembly protein TadG-related protein [Actinomycetes bacterium]|nr:pilus assembly protein TadG-related protein [Actinomycetes bacterium]
MRRLHGDDSGYVAVLVALCLPLFLGLCALAVDVATWYVTGVRAQKAADAAALGGAVYLPADTATARSVALSLVDENGFTVGGGTAVEVNEDESPTRLRVTVSTTVHNTFGVVLGHPTTVVTRTAVADYAGPIQMGSPCNVLGNEAMETSRIGSPACAGQTGIYWLNIAGTDVNKARGDAYASGYCTVPDTDNTIDGCSSLAPAGNLWGGPTNNLDHAEFTNPPSDSGYLYAVHVASPVAELSIQGFDLGWVAVGDRCNAPSLAGADASDAPNPYVDDAKKRYAPGPGPFCTGDSQMSNPQGDPTSKVETVIRFYRPSPSASQPLAGGQVCPPLVLPGWDQTTKLADALDATSPAYDPLLAQTFRRWDSVCTVTAPETGDYIVRVTTNGGGGQNRFALRADVGGPAANADVSVSALGRESLFNNVPAGTTDFYVARLDSGAAGHVLRVGFFDLADAAQPVDVTLLQPDSDTPFTGCSSVPVQGATGHGPLSGCTVTTTTTTNGGLWQEVTVPIDPGYRCSDDRDLSACWVRVRLTTAAGQEDTTTWRAALDGDPVRLVQ